GGFLGDTPNCQLMGGLQSFKGGFRFERDNVRHQRDLKSRVQQVFGSEGMRRFMDQFVAVRRYLNPEISDADARSILVAVQDCTMRALATGPSVMTLKGAELEPMFESEQVGWVLILSDATWTSIESLFDSNNVARRLPEEILIHELTHALMTEAL